MRFSAPGPNPPHTTTTCCLSDLGVRILPWSAEGVGAMKSTGQGARGALLSVGNKETGFKLMAFPQAERSLHYHSLAKLGGRRGQSGQVKSLHVPKANAVRE